MCLWIDLWPHRKEVQALPMERNRDREKIPLGFFPAALWAVGLIVHWDFHRETSRCVLSELHKQGWGWEKKEEGFIVFLLFHLQTWIMEIPDSQRCAEWRWRWMCWVMVTTCLSSCLLWQWASQASFEHISRFICCFLQWANLSRQSGHGSFDSMHLSYLSDEDL